MAGTKNKRSRSEDLSDGGSEADIPKTKKPKKVKPASGANDEKIWEVGS
jgi:hypothetical protein